MLPVSDEELISDLSNENDQLQKELAITRQALEKIVECEKNGAMESVNYIIYTAKRALDETAL
jgi:hypothetical protein